MLWHTTDPVLRAHDVALGEAERARRNGTAMNDLPDYFGIFVDVFKETIPLFVEQQAVQRRMSVIRARSG